MFSLDGLESTSVTFTDGDPPIIQELRQQMLDPIERLTARPGFDEWSKHCQKALTTALKQKRLDKSASIEQVRWLLLSAKTGGMSPRQFELAAAELRPNGGRGVGFNGRLWHYYTTKDNARMSLSTFEEYAVYFFNQGWISAEQREEALGLVVAGRGMLACLARESLEIREIVKKHPGVMSTAEYLFMLSSMPEKE